MEEGREGRGGKGRMKKGWPGDEVKKRVEVNEERGEKRRKKREKGDEKME